MGLLLGNSSDYSSIRAHYVPLLAVGLRRIMIENISSVPVLKKRELIRLKFFSFLLTHFYVAHLHVIRYFVNSVKLSVIATDRCCNKLM